MDNSRRRRFEKMITAGIDCGAKNTKAIIMKHGRIIGRMILFSQLPASNTNV